jgi:hypothetical protein
MLIDFVSKWHKMPRIANSSMLNEGFVTIGKRGGIART